MAGRVHEPVDGVDVLIHVTTKSRELGIFPLRQCRGRGIVVEEGHSDKEGGGPRLLLPAPSDQKHKSGLYVWNSEMLSLA